MDLTTILFFGGMLLIFVIAGTAVLQRSERLWKYGIIVSLLAAVCVTGSLGYAQQKTVLIAPVSPALEGGVQRTCETFAQTTPCTTRQVLYRGYPFAITEQLRSGPREEYPIGTRPTLISATSWGHYMAGDYIFYFIIVSLFAYPIAYLFDRAKK